MLIAAPLIAENDASFYLFCAVTRERVLAFALSVFVGSNLWLRNERNLCQRVIVLRRKVIAIL
jgi:hypothetical protein